MKIYVNSFHTHIKQKKNIFYLYKMGQADQNKKDHVCHTYIIISFLQILNTAKISLFLCLNNTIVFFHVF